MKSLEGYIKFTRDLFDRIWEGIIICDNAGTVKFINRGATAIFGFTPEEAVGKSCEMLFGKETQAMLREPSKQVKVLRIPIKLKSKRVVKAEVLVNTINSDDEVIGRTLVINDPTIDKSKPPDYFTQKNSLIQSLNKLEHTAFFVSDIISGEFIYMSDAMIRIFGWTREDYRSGGWGFGVSLVHPDDQSTAQLVSNRIQQFIEYPFKYDQTPMEFTYRRRKRDGDYIKVNASWLLLQRDPEGTPHYMITFLENVSDPPSRSSKPGLTKRESDIADGLLKGESSKQIANRLGLSVHTVNDMRQLLLKKFSVSNTAELVKVLIEKGLSQT